MPTDASDSSGVVWSRRVNLSVYHVGRDDQIPGLKLNQLLTYSDMSYAKEKQVVSIGGLGAGLESTERNPSLRASISTPRSIGARTGGFLNSRYSQYVFASSFTSNT